MHKEECSCGKTLKVPEKYAGKRISCPECDETVQIPAFTGDDSSSGFSRLFIAGAAGALLVLLGLGAGVFLLSAGGEETGESEQEMVARSALEEEKEQLDQIRQERNKLKTRLENQRQKTEEQKKERERLQKEIEEKEELISNIRDDLARSKEKAEELEQQLEQQKRQESEKVDMTEIARAVAASTVLIRTNKGAGAGFYVSEKGLILTNRHVIEGANTFRVSSFAGEGEKRLNAVPYAIHPQRDLALLQVQTDESVPALELAGGGSVERGTRVLAMGSPGVGRKVLTNSVSHGIISNLNQTIQGNPFLQTTAPINPGNSGGPLVNMDGQVVGVVTAGVKNADNIGFAIPVSAVHDFMRRKEEEGVRVEGSTVDRTTEQDVEFDFDMSRAMQLQTTISDLMPSPRGNGHLLALNYDQNEILKISPSEQEVVERTFVGSNPQIMFATPQEQNLWVYNQGAPELKRIHPRGLDHIQSYKLNDTIRDFAVSQDVFWFTTSNRNLYFLRFSDGQILDAKIDVGYVDYHPGEQNLIVTDGSMLQVIDTRILKRLVRWRTAQEQQERYQNDHRRMSELETEYKRRLRERWQSFNVSRSDADIPPLLRYCEGPGSIIKGRLIYDLEDPGRRQGRLKRNPFSLSSNPVVRKLSEELNFYQIRSVSPDGNYVADMTHIYDMGAYTLERELPAPAPVQTFSRDGKTLWIHEPIKGNLLPVPVQKTETDEEEGEKEEE